MRATTLPIVAGKPLRRLMACVLAALLVVASANIRITPALAQKMDLLPSTPAGVDCAWKTFDSPSLGLKMLVQQCAAPERQYILRTQGNAIYLRAKAGDEAGREQKIIEVFAKPVDVPIQSAIHQRFVAPSAAYKNAGCEVRDIRDLLFLGREQITLDIFPIGQYGYPSELTGKGEAYSVCGDYGYKPDNSRFFSFHPDEDKTKYLFISIPANKSLFDPLSILLYPGALNVELPAAPAPGPALTPAPEATKPVAPPARAETFDWRTAEQIGPMRYFINANASVDAASGYVSGDVLVDSGPRTNGRDLVGLPDGAASKIEHVTIDCKTRHYKTESADLYRENMGKGAVVRHFGQRAGWSFVPGYYVKVFDKLCQPRD